MASAFNPPHPAGVGLLWRICLWCLGLDEGFLNRSIWCWGCFYRSLEVMVKDEHQLNKPNQ